MDTAALLSALRAFVMHLRRISFRFIFHQGLLELVVGLNNKMRLFEIFSLSES